MTTTTPLRGISEIRAFFRTNQTPIYFVSPTAFNLLGIDRWVRKLLYVNYFDSFEGSHPRVFVPQERPYRERSRLQDEDDRLTDRAWIGGIHAKFAGTALQAEDEPPHQDALAFKSA